SIWLIYVISNQLGNKAAITLFLLMILIKFILIERKLFGNKLKALLVLILIILSYIIPYNLYEEKQYEDILIEDTWQEYNQSQINSLIEDDKIILLDISASWCATCKLNKFTTLDNSVVLNFMKLRGIIGMRADITKNLSPEVSTLMKMHKHFGIPFTIIYSKKYPNGKVLKTILSANYLISELKEIN
ncbi:MAG: thioredoxin family protein, partial [Pseudomonadota bacterium]